MAKRYKSMKCCRKDDPKHIDYLYIAEADNDQVPFLTFHCRDNGFSHVDQNQLLHKVMDFLNERAEAYSSYMDKTRL